MDIASFCSCKDLEWHGCYGSGVKYNKYTIPESVKHPAKMSWELLEHIFKHLESMNLLTADSVVIDFMSGTGRTGTMAALRRYRTISVELEPHFIEMIAGYDCDGRSVTDFRIEPCVCKSDTLHKPHKIKTGLFDVECSGNPRIIPVCRCGDKRPHKKHHVSGNKELLEQAVGRRVKWDVIQGDARELTKLLGESDLVGVVSPPYFSQVAFQDKEFIKSIAEDKSQRYRDGRLKGHYGSPEANRRYAEKIMETYSLDPRNIGNLPDAPLAGIVSPPYVEEKTYQIFNESKGFHSYDKDEAKNRMKRDYVSSQNLDNIGNLKDVPLVGIMSPPYQDTAMPMGCPAHIRKLAREGNWDKAIELESKAEAEQAKKGNKFAVSTDETIRKKIEMALEREKGNYSENSDNIGNLKDVPLIGIMSPPYSEAQLGGGIAIKGYRGPHMHEMGKNQPDKVGQRCEYMKEVHGSDPAQIGNLPDKPLVGITSPPYVIDNKNVCHTREGKTLAEYDKKRGYPPTAHQTTDYSTNSENIGNLPDKALVGITSPPYETSLQGVPKFEQLFDASPDKIALRKTKKDSRTFHRTVGHLSPSEENLIYSSNENNIGNLKDADQQGESYLSAMLKVYQQAYLCGISPLVVVTKNPTRNGKLRRLDLDTVYLLHLSGYEVFDYHRSILFESHKQGTLDGESKDVHKGRISFFKRLSLEKGTTVAQFEDVIFARIPIKMRALNSENARAQYKPGAPDLEG